MSQPFATRQINLPAPPRTTPLPAGLDPADNFCHEPTASGAIDGEILFARLEQRYSGSQAYVRAISLSDLELMQLRQYLR